MNLKFFRMKNSVRYALLRLTASRILSFGTVRTTAINGEPYFVGKDVAAILGYSDTAKAIRVHVDDEDKGVDEMDTPGGKQNIILINESGLYSLILSSKLPTAKKFKRWVTSEVLPTIRRHGVYAIDEVLNDPDTLISALTALKAERENNRRLNEKVAFQTQQIAELQPKASYYDLVLSCRDALPISIIAKDYGWSAKKMNRFLHEQGVQYKLGETWLLYAKYAEMGYTKSETFTYLGNDETMHSKVGTKWTQAGRLFIYELMKKAGHSPIIEWDS